MADISMAEEAEIKGNYSEYAEGLITYWGYDVGMPLRVALQHEKADGKALLLGSLPPYNDSVYHNLLANCEMLTECRDRETVTVVAPYDTKRQGYIAQATIFLEDTGNLLSLISSSPQPSTDLAELSLLHISSVVLGHLIHLKAFSPSVRKGKEHKELVTYRQQLPPSPSRPFLPSSVPAALPPPFPRPLQYQAATSVPRPHQPLPSDTTRAMVPISDGLRLPLTYQSRPFPSIRQTQGMPDSVVKSSKPKSGSGGRWTLFGWILSKPTPGIVEKKVE